MQGNLDDVTLLQDITEVCRATVRAFVEERTDKNDQVSNWPRHLTHDAQGSGCSEAGTLHA